MDVLKVAANSSPNSVAGALAGVLREEGGAELQAIGAGAINQAVKAVAIARGFVAPSGIDLVCIPAFTDIEIEGEERTAIKFIVEPRWNRNLLMLNRGWWKIFIPFCLNRRGFLLVIRYFSCYNYN